MGDGRVTRNPIDFDKVSWELGASDGYHLPNEFLPDEYEGDVAAYLDGKANESYNERSKERYLEYESYFEGFRSGEFAASDGWAKPPTQQEWHNWLEFDCRPGEKDTEDEQ